MLGILHSILGRWRHPGTDILSQYLDDELPPRRQQLVARHLEGCESCQAEWDSLRLTVQLLHRVPRAQPLRSFVFEAPPLVERPRRLQGSPNWVLGAAGASLALLLAVLVSADMAGVLSGDGSEETQQSEPAMWADEAPAVAAPVVEMAVAPPPAAVLPVSAAAATPAPPPVQQYIRSDIPPLEASTGSEDATPAAEEGLSTEAVLVNVQESDNSDLLAKDDSLSEPSPEELADEAPAQAAQAVAAAAAATPAPSPAVSTPVTTTVPVPPIPAAPATTGTPTPTAPPATSVPTPLVTGTPAPPGTPAPTPVSTPARTRSSVPTIDPRAPTPTPASAPEAAPTLAPSLVVEVATATPEPTPTPSPISTTEIAVAAAPPVEQTPTEEPAIVVVPDAADMGTPATEPQAAPLPVVDEVDDAGEGGATSVWWRVAQALVAVFAVLLLGAFFWKWRRDATL